MLALSRGRARGREAQVGVGDGRRACLAGPVRCFHGLLGRRVCGAEILRVFDDFDLDHVAGLAQQLAALGAQVPEVKFFVERQIALGERVDGLDRGVVCIRARIHISESTRPYLISYAFFCLKKKKVCTFLLYSLCCNSFFLLL